MYRLHVAIIACFLTLNGRSQLPVLNWVKTFPTNNISNFSVNNNARTVGVDAVGNVYSAGLFQHSVDFDPGTSVYSLEGKPNSQIRNLH